MGEKRRWWKFGKGKSRRIFSMILAFALLVTTMLPTNLLNVKAADAVTNITVHYQNYYGWTTPAIQYWGGDSTVVTGGQGEQDISIWNVKGTVLTQEVATDAKGFYSVSLKGDFDGFQFLDMEEENGKHNATDNICSSYMMQYAGETPQDLYYIYKDTNADKIPDTGKWYTDANGTIELAEPAGATEYNITVHFQNTNNWGTVNAYVAEGESWNSIAGYESYKAWPGVAITENPEHDNWYDLKITKKNNSVIKCVFNDGTNQTGDLDVTVGSENVEAWYIYNTAEVVYEAPEAWTNPAQPGTGEGGNTNASGRQVSDLVQARIDDSVIDLQLYMNGVYEAKTALTAGEHVITLVCNGTDTELTKTVTLAADADTYIRLQEGALHTYVVGAENEKKFIHTAAFTGNFTGLEFTTGAIAGWNPKDENAELAYYGGGLYGRTFTFAELTDDLTLSDGGYKIAFDDDWLYSFGNPSGIGNIGVTIPAGSTSITILVDEINGNVYDDVRTADFEIAQNSGAISGKALQTTVSFIGTARCSDGNDWAANAEGYEFTQISDTLYRYQKVLATGNYSYKCVFNLTNWYEAESDNRNLAIESDNTNVVVLYNTVDGKLYDSINNAEKVAELLGMSAPAAEPAEAKVTDNKNGSTTFQMLAETGSEVTLNYVEKEAVDHNHAVFQKVALKESSEGVYTTDAIYFGDEQLDIVYYYDVNGTKTLDTSATTVTVNEVDYSNYTRAEFKGRGVNVAGTFPGPSWDATSNVMTYLGNGLYSYKFSDVPAANYEFKIAFGSWDPENYGVDGVDHGANYGITVPETQDVTVFYNDFSHRAVTTVDYVFADITLQGTGIPEGVKLSDSGLTGIYSVEILMEPGTYEDVCILYEDDTFEFGSFTISSIQNVVFYFDPTSGIFYNNASDIALETENIYYNSKETAYKSVYGAVATGEEVKFSIETGMDATAVTFVVKGVEKQILSMEKDGEAVDGVQKWSTTTSFSKIGQNTYYFAVSNGSSVKIYADDDGYYGEGTVTDLTSIKAYDLVVYKAGYETPDWMKNAVVYQIFPDRFFDGEEGNNRAQISARGEEDYEYITDWYMLPENPEQEALLTEEEYKATGAYFGDGHWSNEIYGGDLAGITERIDYLKALGVTVIYINPVFSSISSHRYDTSDYNLIDPILGDLGDFTELAEVAEANDMHIILDGVFNHVSDDSKYFDRYYNYLEAGTDTIGAYPYWAYVYDYMAENNAARTEAETAAKTYFTENYGITDYSYTEWFEVYQNSYLKDDAENAVKDGMGQRAGEPVYGYDGWWGYDSMPVVKSTNGSEYQTGNWAEEIIYNEDGTSVTQYWLTQGSDGWRLDVANEVSDETWQKFRESVKALDSEAVIIGEIWDDATEYLLGDMYDSVMNYMFRNAVIAFAKGGNATDAMNTLEKLRERYPEEAFYAMMNLVASHDTTRLLSYLDGIDDDRKQKEIENAFPTYENTSDLAKQMQYLVAFLQFTYAGAPTIYYGDEIGMTGADDPDDRRAFAWGKGNEALVTWYATLAEIRNSYAALRTGTVEAFEAENENGTVNDDVMAYVRRDNSDTMVVLANNSQNAQTICLDLAALKVAGETLTDLISNTAYSVSDESVTVVVPALSGVVLTERVVAVTVDKAALAPAYDASYVIAERDPNYVEKDDSDDNTGDDNAGDDNTGDDNTGDDSNTGNNPGTEGGNHNPATDGNQNQDSMNGSISTNNNDNGNQNSTSGNSQSSGTSVVLNTTRINANTLREAMNRGADIVINMGAYRWKIKAGTITNAKEIDLNVTLNAQTAIPEEMVQNLSNGNEFVEISLDGFSGDFGFEAELTLNVGEQHKGLYGNLFYFNESTNEFEFVSSGLIGENGEVTVGVSHASDYVMIFSAENMQTLSVKGVDTGDNAPIVGMIVLLFAGILILAGAYRKKVK